MKIPTEDFTDETLAIDDTQGDDARGDGWGAGFLCCLLLSSVLIRNTLPFNDLPSTSVPPLDLARRPSSAFGRNLLSDFDRNPAGRKVRSRFAGLSFVFVAGLLSVLIINILPFSDFDRNPAGRKAR